MFARHFVDSLDFARHGRELCGVAPLAQMSRLQDLLADPKGEISYVVRGLPDENGKPMLEIAVEGACQLRCQRCLEGFAYPIKLMSRLVLVPAGELDEFSEGESDGPDSIVADPHLDVLNVIEDEILLGLPFAPKHPVGDCQPAEKGLSRSGANPFAVLAGLKNKQS
jgi:uncharacterized protein